MLIYNNCILIRFVVRERKNIGESILTFVSAAREKIREEKYAESERT